MKFEILPEIIVLVIVLAAIITTIFSTQIYLIVKTALLSTSCQCLIP